VVTAVFAAGVVATNYAVGGSIQWGGRYYAIALPVIVPVAIDAIATRLVGARGPSRDVRLAVVMLVVVSLMASLTAMRVLRYRHDSVASLASAISELAEVAGPSGVGRQPDKPVVVVYNRLTPQLLYGDFADYTWLAPDARDDSGQLAADGLDAAGVSRVVLVGPSATSSAWSDWTEVDRRSSRLGDVVVLSRCPSSADEPC
jgi:hypothetical protein